MDLSVCVYVCNVRVLNWEKGWGGVEVCIDYSSNFC